MRKLLLALPSVLLLGSCSALNDWLEGDVQYKSAKTLPPLEVPPDLTSPRGDDRYALPEQAQKGTATLSRYEAERREVKQSAAAPGTAVLPAVDGMHIERAGTQRWLVVQEPADKLWPVVKEFWQENGFLIRVEQPEYGFMETDWAETRAKIKESGVRGFFSRTLDSLYSTGERDQYRTRLERTADGKATEIYISHRGMEEVYTTRETQASTPGDTKWQPRAPDPELEAVFLRKLMVRLGAQNETARTLTASTASTTVAQQESRAQITKGVDGAEQLAVYEPFDRVWRRVGLALDRVGFTVEDRDRQKGVYFVRYADPESGQNERTFFQKLFNTGSRVKTEQYRVQITQAGTLSQVSVLNKDGAPDGTKSGQRILALLQEQLK